MHNTLSKLIYLSILLLCSTFAKAEFNASIPVIDMNDFHSKTRHHIFVQQLTDAFKSVGFVAVINSGVDVKVLDEAYAEAAKFYLSTTEFKMRGYAPESNGQRGYVPSETAKGNKSKDYKEFYHIGRDYPPEIATKYNYSKNIWPAKYGFKPAMQKLIQALDTHIALIEQAISESLGEHSNYINNMTRHGDFLMRSIYYPANPPENSIWAAAHTDIDLFTILPRSTAAGLQILNANGEWVDVIVPDNAFIINAGDMLQNLTNGVYKSAVHRVVSHDKNVARYSIVAFIHTRPTDNVGPLTKFIKEVGERKYANATQKELLSERLVDLGLNSPELLKELADSGVMDRLIEVNRASPTALRALKAANLATPRVDAYLQHIDAVQEATS